MSKIFELFKKMSIPGLYLPFAFNAVNGQPSVTLLFAHITFILAAISTIVLHFKTDLIIATTTSIIFWVLAVIFYRLGKLDSAKIDLSKKSIELETNHKEDKEKENE